MLLSFAFILAVSMVKDAFEDYIRHVRDRDENESVVDVYDRKAGDFKSI
jgi:hypothetical protein